MTLPVTVCECSHTFVWHVEDICFHKKGLGICSCSKFRVNDSQIFEDTYYALSDNIAGNGYAPSISELCEILGVASKSTVKARLDVLESQGLIERIGPRAVRIVTGVST